jgi:hypothetical protein
MKKLIRCRVCGYVTEDHNLGEVCPLCKVARRAFEPLMMGTASSTRLFLINLDLHAIIVHLSQSLAFIVPLMTILLNVFPAIQSVFTSDTLYFLILIYPIAVLASFISGIFDGFFRLGTLSSRPPLTKILAGALLLALSVVLYFVAPEDNYALLTVILSLASLPVAVFLGMKGKILSHIIIPDGY